MRAGYVLHSLECLECGKCCSNVLRSLRAYGVVPKAVRTCMCEKTIQRTCIAHDARFHTYNRVRGHIHRCIRACRHIKYKHACMPGTYTYLHSSAQRNVYTTLLCTHTSRLCTALTRVFGAWSCGQVLQQCVALPPCLWISSKACTHMHVREERHSARA
jgi:hypothetical protein